MSAMEKLLFLSSFIVILSNVESSEETKDLVRSGQLIIGRIVAQHFIEMPQKQQNESVDLENIRKRRNSAVPSLWGFLERKKLKALKNKNKNNNKNKITSSNKNKTKRPAPIKRLSTNIGSTPRRHKHCYYDNT